MMGEGYLIGREEGEIVHEGLGGGGGGGGGDGGFNFSGKGCELR